MNRRGLLKWLGVAPVAAASALPAAQHDVRALALQQDVAIRGDDPVAMPGSSERVVSFICCSTATVGPGIEIRKVVGYETP